MISPDTDLPLPPRMSLAIGSPMPSRAELAGGAAELAGEARVAASATARASAGRIVRRIDWTLTCVSPLFGFTGHGAGPRPGTFRPSLADRAPLSPWQCARATAGNPARCEVGIRSAGDGRVGLNKAQGGLELGRTGGERASDRLLDRAQALGYRVAIHAEGGGGPARVAAGRKVGAQGLPGDLSPIALFLQRSEVEPAQGGDEEVVAQDRGEQGDISVAHDQVRAALGHRQGGGGLAVGEAPAGEAGGGLAERQRRRWALARGGDGALDLGRVERATGAEPGPGRGLATDEQEARVEGRGELADVAHVAAIVGDEADMVPLEVVGDLGGVERLAGEQAPHALGPAPLGGARPALGLALVLGAHGGEQAVEGRGQVSLEPGGRDRGPARLGLVGEEVAQQGVAG